MSDLAGAAAAMGIPEDLVQRSAEARAEATGSTVEEILAAWAGGGSAPPAAPAPEPVAEVPQTSEPAASAPEVIVEVPTAAPPSPPAAAPGGAAPPPGKPPLLVGSSDNPMTIMIGAIGLFVIIFLVGLVGPSIETASPGARSSEVSHSPAGEAGMTLYGSLGCAGCHTQMVRPVIADVGLGAVTLNDANQPLGTRRFGPDLSDIGGRKSGSEIEAVIGGFDGHPALRLSAEDMNALTAYLVESNTSGGGS